MPVRAALIAIKASLLSRRSANLFKIVLCSKKGQSFSSLCPIFQIGHQNSAGPIEIASNRSRLMAVRDRSLQLFAT